MTIHTLVMLDNDLSPDEKAIGDALKRRALGHFVQFLGQRGLGLNYASCTAAVAIDMSSARGRQYGPADLPWGFGVAVT